MLQINRLPFPGGLFARLVRRLLRGTPMFPIFDFTDQPQEQSIDRRISVGGGDELGEWRELFRDLEAFPDVWVYLHGSQADCTTTSFSDYDDLIVIDLQGKRKTELIKLIDALNRVDMRFCRLDPLQHHGHWIISRQSLHCYDESFMPLLVLSDGLAVQGPQSLEYRLDEVATRQGLKANIVVTHQNIAILWDKLERRVINAYELKALVGSFVLMPAFLFQVQGKSLSKPEAIRRAGSLFSEEALKCVYWSTNCRHEWHRVMSLPGIRLLRALARLVANPHLYRFLASKVAPRVPIDEFGFAGLTRNSVNAFLAESLQVLPNELKR